MQQVRLKILSNKSLTSDVYQMRLVGNDKDAFCAIDSAQAGQFVNIAVDGCFLRRPFSICDIENGNICIVYKVIGEGTSVLKHMPSGEYLDVLIPLGNGFNPSKAGDKPLLVGGGLGTAPLLLLAKELKKTGKEVDVILGFNSKQDIILVDEFRNIGCNLVITTADGSVGQKGFVTDAIKIFDANEKNTYFYACGPIPMLRALYHEMKIKGEMSLEERMGCGFGVCMGCTCKTSSGAKQVCTDGPVFITDDLIF